MKTVFFALASLALILFLYWQWHVPRPVHHYHLVAVTLSAPALALWSPQAVRSRPVPNRPAPAIAQVSREAPLVPPASKVVPTSAPPAQHRPVLHPKSAPAPSKPLACFVVMPFGSPASARLFARKQDLRVVRLATVSSVNRLYRVYLKAATPEAVAAIRRALIAAHVRGYYLMHLARDPQGFSLGAYDALAGAFVRRAQLLRAGLHPHLEIRVHRVSRIRLFVMTRRPASRLPRAWHGHPLHAVSCHSGSVQP
ncbi:MAG: hypothetical protein ACYCS1_03375 [Gammaproteobacteria bacterium]